MNIDIKLNIPDHAKVLEIGGGGSPHQKSTIIVDKFLGSDGLMQRGGSRLVMDRPFIQADGCKLPFPDKYFDYVIASHVIEHIPEKDITKFTNELIRVSHAGYIEAPSPLYETLRDIPEHIWFVACKNNIAHLCLKKEKDIPPQKKLIKPMFLDERFSLIITKYADIWLTGMEWKGSFETRIHKSLNDLWELYDEEEILQKILEGIEKDKYADKIKPISLAMRNYIKGTIVGRAVKVLMKASNVRIGTCM